MILLTFRDLIYRRTRFLVVTLLAAVVFALLFVMTGLVEQFHREPFDTVEAFDASAWIVPEGISGPFTASSTMPSATMAEVDADVTAAVVTSRSSLSDGDDTSEVILVGHTPGSLGTPQTVNGRPAEGPGELVADTSLGLEVDQTATVAGVDFIVVGESQDTTLLAGVPVVFMTLSDAQDLVFRTNEVVSALLVDGEVRALPPGTVALTPDAVAEDVLEPLEGAIGAVDLVRALLWVVAAIIIGAIVYLSALERQRDFAVLKAVGSPNSSLIGSLALQAALVALVSVALAAVIQMFLAPAFPMKVRVPARVFWQLPLLAVLMALVAGAAGMRRVLKSDPAEAFSGAGA